MKSLFRNFFLFVALLVGGSVFAHSGVYSGSASTSGWWGSASLSAQFEKVDTGSSPGTVVYQFVSGTLSHSSAGNIASQLRLLVNGQLLSIGGTITLVSGNDYGVSMAWDLFNGGNYEYFDLKQITADGADPKYSVTFQIPANDTEGVIHYSFYQNGEKINEYSSTPHSPGQELTLNDLESNAEVSMVRVQYEYTWVDVPGSDPPAKMLQATGANITEIVSRGTPALAGSSASPTPAPPPTPIIQNPTPPTPAPTAPTPTPAPTAPAPAPSKPRETPEPKPFPVPVGGGGVTKENLEVATNATVAAINTLGNEVNSSANGIIAAVNIAAAANTTALVSVVNSVNNANAKNVEGHAATVGALNKVNVTLDRVSTGVGQISSKLDGTNNALGAILGELKKGSSPSNVEGGSYDTAGGLAAASSAAAANSTFAGAKPSGDTVVVNGVSTGDGLLPTESVRVGDRDIVIGALSPSVTSAVGILKSARPLILLALSIWFVWSCSSTIEAYVVGLGNIGGGGAQNVVAVENAVPGVAQVKHLASATAIATLGLSAAAAVVAVVDTIAARYGVGVGTILNAFDYPSLGGALAFLDAYFPIVASTALVILRAAVGYMCAPIYLGAAATARFLHL